MSQFRGKNYVDFFLKMKEISLKNKRYTKNLRWFLFENWRWFQFLRKNCTLISFWKLKRFHLKIKGTLKIYVDFFLKIKTITIFGELFFVVRFIFKGIFIVKLMVILKFWLSPPPHSHPPNLPHTHTPPNPQTPSPPKEGFYSLNARVTNN